MLEHERDRALRLAAWRLETQRYAEIGFDREIQRHQHAAYAAAQHHALARELDGTNALVGRRVADGELQRQSKGVEPLVTARPGRHEPADGCLTPQGRAPRRLSS